MTRNANINYQADPTTQFQIADNDNDAFDRTDVSYLANALDLHDHSAGRGKPSARAAASSIDTAAIINLAVTTGKLADNAVTNTKIAANAVQTASILDGTITGPKLGVSAVTNHLGYVPISKGGDTGIGNLGFLPSASLTLSSTGSVVLPAGASIQGSGAVILTGAAGIRMSLGTTDANAVAAQIQNTGASPGYSLGLLNAAASGWDLLVAHTVAAFGVPVQGPSYVSSVAPGTAPFSSVSTTLCNGVNAQFLNGQLGTYYGRATNEVPSLLNGFFTSAGIIPTGWSRNTSADGRLIVGSGVTFGVTFNENAQTGVGWNHTHVGDDHSHTITGSASASATAQLGTAAGGQNVDGLGHTHPITATAAANHATTDPYVWNFPCYALVMAFKN